MRVSKRKEFRGVDRNDFQAVVEQRDEARAVRDRYRAALEATRDALADPNALDETIDSPANQAFAIINHALAASPRRESP